MIDGKQMIIYSQNQLKYKLIQVEHFLYELSVKVFFAQKSMIY